jgi:hypothetical protein
VVNGEQIVMKSALNGTSAMLRIPPSAVFPTMIFSLVPSWHAHMI